MSATFRPAAVAGRFYPADAPALRAAVRACLPASAGTSAAPKILLVPHAGYVYSGPIAGAGYACLARAAGRIRRVVLLGPTHRVAVRGMAIPSVAAFHTPLGPVPLDTDLLAELAALPDVVRSDVAHAQEHALEVQLPFLQQLLGDFRLAPVAVGQVDPRAVDRLLEQVWGGDETLIVISSDLSHYLPYADAQTRDRATVARVLALDPWLSHDEACGATPLAGALIAARRHGLRPRLLDLRNSGDTAGDRDRVVGYAAVAFEPVPDVGPVLLAQARTAIAGRLGLATDAAPGHPDLAAPGASFVTLQLGGMLRGCIGSLRARRPLGEDVRANAVAAAFDDPRFDPLTVAEFPGIAVEVSLLDPAEPFPAASAAEACASLRPGIDGLILQWQGRRATFLPQVWEQLPQPLEFLRALRRKAGLAPDFWATDLSLARYTVCKFREAP
jgi:MEMO1 family protein